MIIKILENRKMSMIYEDVTQNENKITELKIEVPEKYADYGVKISFYTKDGIIGNDYVENYTYELTNAITQYNEVFFYISLINDDKIFITHTKKLTFAKNKIVDSEITPEDINIIDTIIATLENKVNQVEGLVTEIQTKLDRGDFKGDTGDDGFSPIIETEKTGKTTTLTITDKIGTTTTTIKDGEDGLDGKDGQNGRDGVDGVTPVRGTDYWTAEDQQAVINSVLSEIENADEEVF